MANESQVLVGLAVAQPLQRSDGFWKKTLGGLLNRAPGVETNGRSLQQKVGAYGYDETTAPAPFV